MSYLGKVALKASDIRRLNVTSSTSATHTLSWTPPNEQSLIITINGVKQQNNYTISGTTLTLDTALTATDAMEVVGINDIGTTNVPGSGVITNDMLSSAFEIDTAELADDAVTADKLANSINTEIAANTAKVTNATHTGDVTGATALTIANDAVDIAMLSATGTADATTFLRGDNAWASAGGGKVLQFVEANYETEQTTTSATFEDLDNPQPSITLSDSSNKVLVWGCLGGVYKNPDGTGSNDMSLVFQLLRDSSVIQALGDKICNIYGSGNDGNLGIGSLSWTYLDAPGDTSSHTYKVQWKRSSDDGATIGSVSRGGAYSSIILLEIET